MKYVGGWRIVDDDYFLQIPSNSREIFHVVSSMEDTRFSEEACSDKGVVIRKHETSPRAGQRCVQLQRGSGQLRSVRGEWVTGEWVTGEWVTGEWVTM